MKYDTVFISDVHLGTNRCDTKKFISFLDNLKTKKLIMVGDIIDIQCLEKYNTRWKKEHTVAVHKILELGKNGTKIVYILGNHDATARRYVLNNSYQFKNLTLCNRYVHHDSLGKKYLCIHGDMNSEYSSGSWKQYFLNWGYETITPIDHFLNKYFGLSLVTFLKNIKRGKEYINRYEADIADYAMKKFDGVICGHIHHANIRNFGEFKYMCCGDWCDSFTAIAETKGNYEILRF
jgi:UDP-2,3-diacylglucosamine pyrophosphatase LpxH